MSPKHPNFSPTPSSKPSTLLHNRPPTCSAEASSCGWKRGPPPAAAGSRIDSSRSTAMAAYECTTFDSLPSRLRGAGEESWAGGFQKGWQRQEWVEHRVAASRAFCMGASAVLSRGSSALPSPQTNPASPSPSRASRASHPLDEGGEQAQLRVLGQLGAEGGHKLERVRLEDGRLVHRRRLQLGGNLLGEEVLQKERGQEGGSEGAG